MAQTHGIHRELADNGNQRCARLGGASYCPGRHTKACCRSNPAGALIDILLTIYNLIVFFVERFQQILDFATSVFDSIGKIARGQLADAAAAVEDAMAKTIPIIISFMVRLLGLPDIGGTIRRIITNVRARVHAAFDRVLNWLIKKVKKLIARLVSRFRRDTPADRVSFSMDGEQHEMWADDTGGNVRVMMASEENEVPENAADVSKEEFDKSADASDGAGAAAIQNLDPAQDQVEAEEDRLEALPETNRSTPAARERLRQKIEALTPLLEQASVRPNNAATVDEDNAELDADPPDGEGALDRTEFPMRRRIRTTLAVEGAAGSWQAMTAVWEEAKTKATNDADVFANLARDHIPEFALLARVSRMAKPGLTRSGAPSMARMFPQLNGNVPNPDSGAKPSNPNLPVLIIRTAINSQVGANSAKLSAWDSRFRQLSDRWIPSEFETQLTDEAREQATSTLTTEFGPAAIIEDMQSHIDEIKSKYGNLPPQTMDDDFNAHIDGRALPVLQQLTQNIYGGGGGDAPSTEGAQEGINIPYDNTLAENELKMAPYKELPEHGLHMQRHHLLEESIVRSFRDRQANLTLGTVMGGMVDTLASQIVQAAKAGLGAEQRAALAETPDRQAETDAVLPTLRAAINGVTLSTGMNTGQGPHDNGIAINVLNTVNQLAGSQPVGNVDTTLGQMDTDFQSQHTSTVRNAVMTRVSNAFVGIAAGDGPSASDLQAGLAGDIGGEASSMESDLGEGREAAFGALTSNAFTTFQGLQRSSIEEISATGDAASIERAGPMQQRFAELTREQVIHENLEKWFGG